MKCCTVCMFGHRKIDDLDTIEKRLRNVVKEITNEYDFIEVLLGRNGELDEFAASIIKSIQKEGYRSQIEITLVLPYMKSNIDVLEAYYDRIVIPDCCFKSYPKSAIRKRNHYMVNCSDVVIGYVKQEGGASEAFRYAKKIFKKTINLANNSIFS